MIREIPSNPRYTLSHCDKMAREYGLMSVSLLVVAILLIIISLGLKGQARHEFGIGATGPYLVCSFAGMALLWKAASWESKKMTLKGDNSDDGIPLKNMSSDA